MNYLMGIDLGTSSVKVLIMDDSGKIAGMGKANYGIRIPKIGYAEQDPAEWWECTKAAICEALKESMVAPGKILGIGFSGQMHGMVALDGAGNPVCPAIIHLDQRSAEERTEIIEAAKDLMEKELLNQPGSGMLICTLLWVKKNQPEIYQKIANVMLPKDYIRYRLTGKIECEYTDASSTLAFSVKKNNWCFELIDRLDLKKSIWPQIRAPFEIVGTVSDTAAADAGLSSATKVVAGGGDSAMALLGNGIVREGIMACNIGTASQVAAVVKKPLFDRQMRCQTWRHPSPETWYVQGGTLNGGNTISWLRNKVLTTDKSFSELDREVDDIPAGSEGLIFIPFLAGERTPFMDPQAKGVYFGLGMKHDYRQIFRATMEGVAYNLCECKKVFSEMGITSSKLVFSGGGAKSNVWTQIIADVLNVPIYTTESDEEACMGAAITAAVGTGCYGTIEEACDTIIHLNNEPVMPVPENVDIYLKQQMIFKELYFKVRNIFPELQNEIR